MGTVPGAHLARRPALGSPPVKFVAKRAGRLVLVILAVTFLSTTFLSLLPGDAAAVKCGGGCTAERYEQIREDMGLNKSILGRYVSWLTKALPPDVDLGRSDINNEAVTTALTQRLPVTLELLVFSQFIALSLAIPIGVLSSRRPNGIFDKATTAVGFLFLAVPPFVLGLVLMTIFAVKLRWVPATGYTALTENPLENVRSLVLPSFALAVGEIAVFSRLLRTDLMATLQEDYIMMAKAKGLTSRRIMWRHAFRPSLFSLVTVLGLRMGALIGGALILEGVFVINGLGRYAITAISNRDYIPLQGAIVLIATGYVLINFTVDLVYALIDPRIRHARALA
jgi:peptide/nickel transport system permease protein